jgi:O-antigen/teichoic acid export membrane protein
LSEIRVTYSGLISFITSISTLFTGLAFMLIITRTLTPEEYGTWTVISSLILYGVILAPVISFWNTREIARGIESTKTAIIGSMILSILGVVVYLITIFVLSYQTEIKLEILLFGIVWIPTIFVNRVLVSVNLGFKPHLMNYGLITLEISKILSALFFLQVLEIGIYGVIVSYAISTLISNVILLYFVRKKLVHKIKRDLFLKWIKLSWVPGYFAGFTNLVFKTDIIIFAVIINSMESLSYFAAATLIAGVVISGGTIATGLYPKLLEGKQKQVSETLRLVFYFSIPLLMTAIVFSKAGLYTLNPTYAIAVPITIFITFRFFFHTLTNIFSQIMIGDDKVDLNEKASFRDYTKSKLFFMPNLRVLQFSIYLITLIILFQFGKDIYSEFELIIFWSIISVIVQIPLTIYLYFVMKQQIKFELDRKILIYLVIALGVFGLTNYLVEEYLIFTENIFEFLPNMIIYVFFAMILYFSITLLVDNKTRNIVKGIIKELK